MFKGYSLVLGGKGGRFQRDIWRSQGFAEVKEARFDTKDDFLIRYPQILRVLNGTPWGSKL